MKPFSVTLTHSEAHFIYTALQFYSAGVQKQVSDTIMLLETEFQKANAPENPEMDSPETSVDENKPETVVNE